jgi:hypothetical protein|uniref:Uncharacterized protein n=1 Tax=viral metagenome TaxID=1070528 RepID=A0A6C0IPE3_9ZZZZ
MNLLENLFILLNYVWYILFALAYFDIWQPAVVFLDVVTFYFKIFVSLFLIYFFNPYKFIKFTEFHRRIVFTAGTFMLFSEGLMYVFNKMTGDAVSVTKKVTTTASDIIF